MAFFGKSLSRAEKSLVVAVAFAFVLLGTVGGFNISRNAEPNIVFPTPVPRPTPNGFDGYLAAKAAIIAANPPVDQVNNPKILAPAIAAKQYSLTRKKAWLKMNARGFALFQSALKTPAMHPDSRPNPNNFPRYAHLRELARCKVIEANAAKMENRPFGALQSALDTMEMGGDAARGGPVMSYLVGVAIGAIGRSSMEDFDATLNALNANEAKAGARRLEKILAEKPTLLSAVEEERWIALSQIQTIFKESNWRSMDGEWTWKERLEMQLVSKKQIVSRVNEGFDRKIAALKNPAAPVAEIEKLDPISKLFDPSYLTRAGKNEWRSNLGDELLLLRLALRAFRLENGAFPSNLNQLAPRYLAKIPTDDFNAGKPYFYRLKGQKYELWSVGPDGINDNGTPIPYRASVKSKSKPASVLFESKGDFVAGQNR